MTHIDWQRKVAHVEMSDAPGRSRWKGAGQGLSFRLCQAIKRVLATDGSRPCWSQRARTQIETIRVEFPWLTVDASAVVTGPDDGTKWWTFAGQKANAALAPALANMTQIPTTSDSLSIDFDRPLPEAVQQAIDELRSREPRTLLPEVTPEALEGLKFSECLPPAIALHSLATRRRDQAGLAQLLEMTIRFVSVRGADPG